MLWSRLTERDRRVLALVERHRVLTTEQLQALEFGSRRRAQHRLAELFRLGVLWRFRFPLVAGGSMPWHYTLGYQGARLLAARRGTDPPRPATFATRLERLAESPKLRHQLGVNRFFADLADYARRAGLPEPNTAGGEGLQTWRSENETTDFYREYRNVELRPDGYGCWVEHGRVLGFYLEYDTGSEVLGQVVDKLDSYVGQYETIVELLHGMILFWVHSHRRETALRSAFAKKACPVPIATASRDYGDPDGPAGAVWSILGPPGRPAQARVRLGDLSVAIGGTEPDGRPTVLARRTQQREEREQARLAEIAAADRAHELRQQREEAAWLANETTQPIPIQPGAVPPVRRRRRWST